MVYACTVVKATGTLLLAGFLLTTLSACGLVQVNRVENMSPQERVAYLNGLSTGRLCNALMNPYVKAHTVADIRQTLSSREITTCYRGDQEQAVASQAADRPIVAASETPAASMDAAPIPPEVVSPPAQAQGPATSGSYFSKATAITLEYWKAWLPADDRRKDLLWLTNHYFELLKEANALQAAGHSQEADVNTLMALYVLLHLESLDYYRNKIGVQSDGLKTTVINLGLKQSVIDESLRNLAIAVPIESINYRAKDAHKRAKYRTTTAAEVKTIKRIVTRSLKDPASSIFGRSMMIGDGYFCAEVNAKNSYGGYVGMKSLIYKRLDGRWNYWDESPMDAAGCAKAVATLILEHDW